MPQMKLGIRNFKQAWRETLWTLGICGSVYVLSYVLNSFLGGYWMRPEMDGHDRYSFGLAMPTACMWQPRLGHEAIGKFDFLGVIYQPLIRLDRRLVHPTIYLSDTNGFERITHLPVSRVHPHWRDAYVTEVTVAGTWDEAAKMIRCSFRYKGSDNPREIYEFRMSRKLMGLLGVSAPTGFASEPLTDFDKRSKNPDLHWMGHLPLASGQDVTLLLPAAHMATNEVKIVFYYHRTDDETGDSRQFCVLHLK